MNLMTESKRQCRRDDDRIEDHDDIISKLFNEERIRKDLTAFYKYTSYSHQGDEWRLYFNLTSIGPNISATSYGTTSSNGDVDDTYDFPQKDDITCSDDDAPTTTVPLIQFDIDDIAVGGNLRSHLQWSKFTHGNSGEDYSIHSLDVQIDEDVDEGWTDTEEGDEAISRASYASSLIHGYSISSRYSATSRDLQEPSIPASPVPNNDSTISALVAARKMTLIGLRNASSSANVTSTRRSTGSPETGLFLRAKDIDQYSSWETQSTMNTDSTDTNDVSENTISLAKNKYDINMVPRPYTSHTNRSIAILKSKKREMEKMMMIISSA